MSLSQPNSRLELSRVPVDRDAHILPDDRGTPVGDLLHYHNLGAPHRSHTQPDLLIVTCMDHRVQLRMPPNFAFVLRSAGANVSQLEFDFSFAIAVAGIRSVCLIGHDQCRMVGVRATREQFVSGLIQHAGWNRQDAEELFDEHAPRYEIPDPAEFIWLEAQWLRGAYADITVTPLFYAIEDRRLYQLTDALVSPGVAAHSVDSERGERPQ